MKRYNVSFFALMAFSLLLLSACGKTTSTEEEAANAVTQSDSMNSNDDLTTNYNNSDKIMKFELVKLPYAPNALEPVISERTINLHHGKHLQTYVNNLNKQIEGTEFADMELVDIVKKAEGGIFNNAGQTLNHNLYFLQFTPNGGGKPSGELLKAIEAKWGDFDSFVKDFEEKATGLFGAGWAWLASDKEGNLSIENYSNAGNPVVDNLTPLMGADVWEHAYYLDYENRRAEHLKKIWDILNWEEISKRYTDR